MPSILGAQSPTASNFSVLEIDGYSIPTQTEVGQDWFDHTSAQSEKGASDSPKN